MHTAGQACPAASLQVIDPDICAPSLTRDDRKTRLLTEQASSCLCGHLSRRGLLPACTSIATREDLGFK